MIPEGIPLEGIPLPHGSGKKREKCGNPPSMDVRDIIDYIWKGSKIRAIANDRLIGDRANYKEEDDDPGHPGIKDFHFHDLRHTSASYLVMRGASMKAVQVHLGHTTLAMTERYAHLSPDFLKSEVEKLSGVFVRGEEAALSKKFVRSVTF